MDPCAKVKGLITELISPVRVRFNRVDSENVFDPSASRDWRFIARYASECSGGLDVHFEFCQLDVTFECDYL